MEALLIPVPCICAADASGSHPIELRIETRPGARGEKPPFHLRSLRTPCDRSEAGAVDRLGGISCMGAINDIREILRGVAGNTPGVRDTFSVQIANALPGANSSNGFLTLVEVAETARSTRNIRASARREHIDYMATPPPPRQTLPAPPFIRHLLLVEQLCAERLRRQWVGVPPSDIRFNLRLVQPQTQISWTYAHGQAVFEFLAIGRRRREPGWRLKQGTGEASTDHTNRQIELLLDEVLPRAAMRGALCLWKRGSP